MNADLVNRSLQVLEQGLNLAVANGAYKSAKDVSSVVNALEIVTAYVKSSQEPGGVNQQLSPQVEEVAE